MIGINLLEVQEALFTALRGDAALTALIPADRITNHMPQDEPFPYLYAHLEVGDWSNKSTVGYEATITLDSWTDYDGDRPLLLIHTAIMNLLNRQPLTLSSGQNVLLQHSRTTFLREDDQTHHSSVAFTALLAE